MALRSHTFWALMLCVGVLLTGTLGYMAIEGYSLFDGLYMSAITMSTVGFGEVRPLSTMGRGFTTVLILFSFVSLIFAGRALGESMLERVWHGQNRLRKMKKKIVRLKGHYIICGYGRVGAAAAVQFSEKKSDLVIIEASVDQHKRLADSPYFYVEGDATQEDVLIAAGIKRAKGLMALLDSDPDNLFVVLSARELNPTLKILSRASERSSGDKIIRAGADKVISPLTSAGRQIANDMLSATGHADNVTCTLPTSALPEWIMVNIGSSMVGHRIEQLSSQMGCQILGLRRNGQDMIFPDAEVEVKSGDLLLVFDETRDVESTEVPKPPQPKRIVIVDDNPVIVKLYTRLFQKAGFIPISCTDGQAGLEVILQEKPHAAVIDFMLPVMSGIEICRQVRFSGLCDHTKLILFTADENPDTRKRALDAGAHAVVVKSPEAKEVIEMVTQILNKDRIGNEINYP